MALVAGLMCWTETVLPWSLKAACWNWRILLEAENQHSFDIALRRRVKRQHYRTLVANALILADPDVNRVMAGQALHQQNWKRQACPSFSSIC